MQAQVCYLGDDDLAGAAAYLAGVMHWAGISFDHVPSAQAPPHDFSQRRYSLYVVSDYPSARFRRADMLHIVRCVEEGSGLLMLGGWESFFGRLGEYHTSPLAGALPVFMAHSDDRRNCPQPCLVVKVADHEILEGLPWENPPCIGGYNGLEPKPGATVVLKAVAFSVWRQRDAFCFTPHEEAPLLVLGEHGRGRTAALATDPAPHWVGGLVDWGDQRIVQPVAGTSIEVGCHYARFFRNLLAWTAGP